MKLNKLGIGVYDSYDRAWCLCYDFSKKPYNTYEGTRKELIEKCIELNKKTNLDVFGDHHGVIKYELDEHGLISHCIEIWCPYRNKDRFRDLEAEINV